MHGQLPRSQDLGKYSPDRLKQLKGELEQSVRQRIRTNIELGSDKAHGQRQAVAAVAKEYREVLEQMMAKSADARQLISDLLSDPDNFNVSGDGYSLLQRYFEGYPVETLGPLLRHVNPMVQRAAVWVASELGSQASVVLEDVAALVSNPDRYLAYHALEVAAVCAVGPNARYLTLVLTALESDDSVLRILAMRLLGNSDDETLKATLPFIVEANRSESAHYQGLRLLLKTNSERRQVVKDLLQSESSLLRKYGAILARRACNEDQELIFSAVASSDTDVRSYAEQVINVHQFH